jgi:hypothetical protein
MYLPVQLTWAELRALLDAPKYLRHQHTELGDRYNIWAWDGAEKYETSILKDGGADVTEYEATYKAAANKSIAAQSDTDGAYLQRLKVTQTGWSYQLHGIEFETCNLTSIYSKKADGTDFGFASIKVYDVNEAEMTTQVNADINGVETVIDWEPDHPYEIIGGALKQVAIPAQDVRVWIVGVPDVPAIYGGSKEFVTSINLRHVGLEEGVRADGRAAKRLDPGAPGLNKMRVILRHPAGYKHKSMLIMEIFKP